MDGGEAAPPRTSPTAKSPKQNFVIIPFCKWKFARCANVVMCHICVYHMFQSDVVHITRTCLS